MDYKFKIGYNVIIDNTTHRGYLRHIGKFGTINSLAELISDEGVGCCRLPAYYINIEKQSGPAVFYEHELRPYNESIKIIIKNKITNKVYKVVKNKEIYYLIFNNGKDLKINKSIIISGYIKDNKIYAAE